METFWTILVVFILLPIIGVAYCNGVHWLGAFIVKHLPPRYVRILSKRLYVTEYDKARAYDRVAMEAEDKLNKRNAY